MQKTSTSSICCVFLGRGSAYRHLYRLLAILGVVFIAAEIGSCGDETKFASTTTSIVFKDNNPSNVYISIKDKTPFEELIPAPAQQTALPKVTLNVNAYQQKTAAITTVQENHKTSKPVDNPQTTKVAPVQPPHPAVNKVVAGTSPQPPVVVKANPPRESSQVTRISPQINTAASAPAAKPNIASTRIEPSPLKPLQPTSPTVVPSTVISPPMPVVQTVAQQQVVPPVPAMPVSIFANPQIAPAPQPQNPPLMAMAPVIRPVKAADSETKKNSGGQSSQAPAATQAQPQMPIPPSLEGAAPQSNGTTPATPSNNPDQKLGEAPRDTSLEFLRKETILLKPAEWQIDVGLSYLIFDNQFTDVIPPSTLAETRLRRRLLTMPLEFRYGLFERVQLFASAPFGWANTEISRVGDDDFFNNGGIGDTNFGGTYLFHKSSGMSYSPDILTTFGMTAPTGNGNALLGLLESPSLTLGQGFWAGWWNVLAIHKYDPVIVFYGVGSRHYFSRDVEGFTGAKPGDQYTYQLGTGFAINERITLSTTLFGSYITEARLNDQVLQGTILEPMYLRFATTVTRPNHHIVEPFVEVGLTDDSANARIGITWTF